MVKWTRGWPSPAWGGRMTGMQFLHSSWGDMQQNVANCYSTIDRSMWPLCWHRTLASLTCARQDILKCWIVRVGLWEDREGPGACCQTSIQSLFILLYLSGVLWGRRVTTICIWRSADNLEKLVLTYPGFHWWVRVNFSTAGKLYHIFRPVFI